MEIVEKLSYGVSENIKKELLYIKKIVISNYKNADMVEKFMSNMSIMSNFNIYQYNYNDSKTSDYFMWQYVDNKGIKNWQSVDLCCYQDNIESVYKMWKLKEICENTYIDLTATIYYDDIRNLVKNIEEV